MSVYVDNAGLRYGRMKMCHMIADTTEELIAMAMRIGVPTHWIQNENTMSEHFDICLSKRKLAVGAGAIEVSSRMLVVLIGSKTMKPNPLEELQKALSAGLDGKVLGNVHMLDKAMKPIIPKEKP